MNGTYDEHQGLTNGAGIRTRTSDLEPLKVKIYNWDASLDRKVHDVLSASWIRVSTIGTWKARDLPLAVGASKTTFFPNYREQRLTTGRIWPPFHRQTAERLRAKLGGLFIGKPRSLTMSECFRRRSLRQRTHCFATLATRPFHSLQSFLVHPRYFSIFPTVSSTSLRICLALSCTSSERAFQNISCLRYGLAANCPGSRLDT